MYTSNKLNWIENRTYISGYAVKIWQGCHIKEQHWNAANAIISSDYHRSSLIEASIIQNTSPVLVQSAPRWSTLRQWLKTFLFQIISYFQMLLCDITLPHYCGIRSRYCFFNHAKKINWLYQHWHRKQASLDLAIFLSKLEISWRDLAYWFPQLVFLLCQFSVYHS